MRKQLREGVRCRFGVKIEVVLVPGTGSGVGEQGARGDSERIQPFDELARLRKHRIGVACCYEGRRVIRSEVVQDGRVAERRIGAIVADSCVRPQRHVQDAGLHPATERPGQVVRAAHQHGRANLTGAQRRNETDGPRVARVDVRGRDLRGDLRSGGVARQHDPLRVDAVASSSDVRYLSAVFT